MTIFQKIRNIFGNSAYIPAVVLPTVAAVGGCAATPEPAFKQPRILSVEEQAQQDYDHFKPQAMQRLNDQLNSLGVSTENTNVVDICRYGSGSTSAGAFEDFALEKVAASYFTEKGETDDLQVRVIHKPFPYVWTGDGRAFDFGNPKVVRARADGPVECLAYVYNPDNFKELKVKQKK